MQDLPPFDYPMNDRSFSEPSSVDSSAKQKKPRKQRNIKNAIVNIDDVFIEPGISHINWVNIARNKLAERELILLHHRQETCDNIIISAIQSFTDENMVTFASHTNHPFMQIDPLNIYVQRIRHRVIDYQSAIILRSHQSICTLLRQWKGYKADDPEKDIRSFREYFQRSRHWFDTKKIKAMSSDFWIPTMQLIQEFADTVASEIYTPHAGLQKLYAEHLNLLILKQVFVGQIKPNNARKMWLIPAMSYPVFLKDYNENLQIEIERRKIPGSKNKYIRQEYVKCINLKSNVLRESFYDAMDQYVQSTSNSFFPPPMQPSPISPVNPAEPFPVPMNWDSPWGFTSTSPSFVTNDNNNNNNNNNNYNGPYPPNVNVSPPVPPPCFGDNAYNGDYSYFDPTSLTPNRTLEADGQYTPQHCFEDPFVPPMNWNACCDSQFMPRMPMNVPPLGCGCNVCCNHSPRLCEPMVFSAPPNRGCNCNACGPNINATHNYNPQKY